MRHVPLAAFKDKASEFIAAAERGEEIVITKHGRPAARLSTAVDPAEHRARAEAALARLMEHRERMRADGMTATIEELIAWKNEGRP